MSKEATPEYCPVKGMGPDYEALCMPDAEVQERKASIMDGELLFLSSVALWVQGHLSVQRLAQCGHVPVI